MVSVNRNSLVFCGFLVLIANQFVVVQSQLLSGVVTTVGNVLTNFTEVVENPTTKALCDLTTVDLSFFFQTLA